MTCDDFREALSARLDGEAPLPATAGLDAHLLACARCAEFERAAIRLAAETVPLAVEPVADRTAGILAAIDRHRTRVAGRRARAALIALAAIQLLVALPGLLGPGPEAGHSTRELSAFTVALAVGLLYAAWSPARADGLVPVMTALVGCLLLTAVVDLDRDQAHPAGETLHLLAPAGLLLLRQLTRSAPALGVAPTDYRR